LVLALASTALPQQKKVGSGISTGHSEGNSFPRIESKPDPARANKLVSQDTTVTLQAIFTDDGRITDVKFLKIVPETTPKDVAKSLTKLCKKAAYQIKFIPAQRSGHPVSMYMRLEYLFSNETDSGDRKP